MMIICSCHKSSAAIYVASAGVHIRFYIFLANKYLYGEDPTFERSKKVKVYLLVYYL